MKVFVVTPDNLYDVPGTLGRALDAHPEVQATTVAYDAPVPGDKVDHVFQRMHPNAVGKVVEALLDADLVHVFGYPFSFQGFDLEAHLRADNCVFTYEGRHFARQGPKAFFRHFRRDIIATVLDCDPYRGVSPLPALHLLPVLDTDEARPAPRPLREVPVVTVSSSAGRTTAELAHAAISELRGQHDLSLAWLEGLSRRDTMRELARTDILVDDLAHPGPTPIGFAALALGVVVVTNLSGLEPVHHPGFPVVATRPGELRETLERLLADPQRLAEASTRSVEWAATHLDPDAARDRWLALYRHVLVDRQLG